MPDQAYGDPIVPELNRIALNIMGTNKIPNVDLYNVTTAHCGQIYTDCDWCRIHPCSYHYNSVGESAQGHAVSAAILKRLQDDI
jgi:hypothetical protein